MNKKIIILGLLCLLLMSCKIEMTEVEDVYYKFPEKKNYVEFVFNPLSSVEKVNVCIIDVFKNENENLSHGKKVSDIVSIVSNQDIQEIEIDIFDQDLPNKMEKWASSCDVINISYDLPRNATIDNIKQVKDIFKPLFTKIKDNDTLIVISAGNDKISLDEFPHIFSDLAEESNASNNIIVVSQGTAKNNKLSSANVTMNTGEAVDFVVLNDKMILHKKKERGSSFAAPIVTGLVGNLLAYGIEPTEITSFLDTGNNFKDEEITYKAIMIKSIYESVQ